MNTHTLETRSALPLETRSDDNTDPLAAATAAVEEIRAAAETRHTAHQTELRAAADRIAALETRLNRPGQQSQEDGPSAETRAFGTYLRRGDRGLSDTEVRALTVSTDAAGGFLVPETFVAELLRNVVNFSPVRQYARVMQIASADVTMPKRTANLTAQWVSETGGRPATQREEQFWREG